ncbi:putative immunity protein [Mumia sp. Pv4-285]
MTIRCGGTLIDADHHLLALWTAVCAEHVLDLFESPAATRVRHAGRALDPRRVVSAHRSPV